MRNAECGITRVVRGRDMAVHSAFHIPHSTFDLMPDDLADVYRTTYRALVRFLYRKVWDAERAEDLAQEAFARALVHKPAHARGWLFVVAANMARDDARRAARRGGGVGGGKDGETCRGGRTARCPFIPTAASPRPSLRTSRRIPHNPPPAVPAGRKSGRPPRAGMGCSGPPPPRPARPRRF